MPFLDTHHADGDYHLMARSHYAKGTVQLYKEEHIAFIPEAVNPPNCPQLHPTEDFWGWLKAKVYECGWEAKSVCALKQRIRKKLEEFKPEDCQRLLRNVKSNLRKAADHGVLSLNH